jgi:hypothetical protein
MKKNKSIIQIDAPRRKFLQKAFVAPAIGLILGVDSKHALADII